MVTVEKKGRRKTAAEKKAEAEQAVWSEVSQVVVVDGDEAAKAAKRRASQIAAFEAAVEAQWSTIYGAGDDLLVTNRRVDLTVDEAAEVGLPHYADTGEPTPEEVFEARTMVRAWRHQKWPKVMGVYRRGGEGPYLAMATADVPLLRAAIEGGDLSSILFYEFEGTDAGIQLASVKMGGGEKGGRTFYEIGLVYEAMKGQVDVRELQTHFPDKSVRTLRDILWMLQNRVNILVTDFGYTVGEAMKLKATGNATYLGRYFAVLDNEELRKSPTALRAAIKEIMVPVLEAALVAETNQKLSRIEEAFGMAAGELTVEKIGQAANVVKQQERELAELRGKLSVRDPQAALAGRMVLALRERGIVPSEGKQTPESIMAAMDEWLNTIFANADTPANPQ